MRNILLNITLLMLVCACGPADQSDSDYLGQFNIERNLFLAHP